MWAPMTDERSSCLGGDPTASRWPLAIVTEEIRANELDRHFPVRGVTSAGEWCLIRSPRDLDSGLYAEMAVMVTSSSVGFWFVILVRRLLARMSRPR